jgi:UDP-N-acetylmuramoylalanine-D-glutamate ligase
MDPSVSIGGTLEQVAAIPKGEASISSWKPANLLTVFSYKTFYRTILNIEEDHLDYFTGVCRDYPVFSEIRARFFKGRTSNCKWEDEQIREKIIP